jgi:hypothetical protein
MVVISPFPCQNNMNNRTRRSTVVSLICWKSDSRVANRRKDAFYMVAFSAAADFAAGGRK